VVEGFPVCASKPAVSFGDLGLKITVMVFWFEPQNQVGFGLSFAPENLQREVNARHTSRSSGLLHVEANLTRVSLSGPKTGGCVMAGGACDTITEVTSEVS
jgi:hypothetical protein